MNKQTLNRIIYAIVLILIVFGVYKFTYQKNEEPVKKDIIVTSIAPLAGIVQDIAGKNFEVMPILSENVSHENFDPQVSDIKYLEDSKVFFNYGLFNYEIQIGQSLKDSKNDNVLEGLPLSTFLAPDEDDDHDHDEHDHDHEHAKEEHEHHEHHHHHHHEAKYNPHVWFSFDINRYTAKKVLDKLSQLYPNQKSTFEANYKDFIAKLDNLQKFANENLKGKDIDFIIYHPTMGYFIKDYDIHQIAVEADGKAPSASDIKEIIDEAKEHHVTKIFVQPQFPTESMNAISSEVKGATVIQFNTDKKDVLNNLKFFIESLVK